MTDWQALFAPIIDEFVKLQNHQSSVVRSGVYVPLYAVANVDKLLSVMSQYPRVPVLVAINPNSGPASVPEARFTTAISRLQERGARVLGYIPTNYARSTTGRTLSDILQMMQTYIGQYGRLDGFMLDEVATGGENRPFYQACAAQARALGCPLVKGNPGALTSAALFDVFDTINVVEGMTPPSLANAEAITHADWIRWSKFKFTMTLYNIATPDWNQLDQLSRYFGWIYVTNDTTPNPYDTLPAYLPDLFSTLDHPGEW